MAKATATRKVTRKFLGRVAVDMGRLFICDPCYLPELRFDGSTVVSDNPYMTDLIIQTDSYGDGLFAVYEERSKGRIRLVVELTEKGDTSYDPNEDRPQPVVVTGRLDGNARPTKMKTPA
jgi:hypothetical protein